MEIETVSNEIQTVSNHIAKFFIKKEVITEIHMPALLYQHMQTEMLEKCRACLKNTTQLIIFASLNRASANVTLTKEYE